MHIDNLETVANNQDKLKIREVKCSNILCCSMFWSFEKMLNVDLDCNCVRLTSISISSFIRTDILGLLKVFFIPYTWTLEMMSPSPLNADLIKWHLELQKAFPILPTTFYCLIISGLSISYQWMIHRLKYICRVMFE